MARRVPDHARDARAVAPGAGVAEALLDASSDGLLVLRDGVPLALNDRLCELLGATRQCLLREGLDAAVWPDEAREAIAAVEAGGRASRETSVGGVGGRRVPATVTATRLVGPGLLVVEVRDATDRELAFDTISILHERLRA